MTGLLRLSLLVLVALLGASCGLAAPAGSPSGSTAALASPTPRPKATPFPIPTPRYTMPPAGSRCPTLNEIYVAPDTYLNLLTARGSYDPPTVAVGRPPLLLPFRPAVPPLKGGGSGVLLGGRSLEAAAEVVYSSAEYLQASAQITSVDLTLEVPGSAPLRLATAMASAAGDSRKLLVDGVPNVDAEGILRVRIGWTDRCYEYVAEGPMHVRVVSAASASVCAPGEEAGWQQFGTLFQEPLAFGAASAGIAPNSAVGVLVDVPIIDGPYPILMFDPKAAPATARPGEPITFHATNPDLVLGVREDRPIVELYDRDAVIRHIDAGGVYGGGGMPPAPVFESPLAVRDGVFEFSAPDAPGRYVAGISLDFTSPCFSGGVVAGAGLDVE